MEKCWMRVLRCTNSYVVPGTILRSFFAAVEVFRGKSNIREEGSQSFLLYGHLLRPSQPHGALVCDTERKAIDYFNIYCHEWIPDLHNTSDWLVVPLLRAHVYWRDMSDMEWIEVEVPRRTASLCV